MTHTVRPSQRKFLVAVGLALFLLSIFLFFDPGIVGMAGGLLNLLALCLGFALLRFSRLHSELNAEGLNEIIQICKVNQGVCDWVNTAQKTELPLLLRDLYAARRSERIRQKRTSHLKEQQEKESTRYTLKALLHYKALLAANVLDTVRATNKQSAVELIESKTDKIVDLDYEGGYVDEIELAGLGQKFGVRVIFRKEDAVLVQTSEELRDAFFRISEQGLESYPKWRRRFIFFRSDMAHEVERHFREKCTAENIALIEDWISD